MVLSLEDEFTTGMARAAAAAALLSKELNTLDGAGKRSMSSVDRSTKSNTAFAKSTTSAVRSSDDLNRSLERGGASIDKYSGRLSLLANVAGLLGPATIPIATAAVPAISGLAAQFGFAALGAGTAVAAFQGVGDALKALNKAQLQPTTENLQAARVAMQDLSPAAQDFVRQLDHMIPALKGLRDTAATGLLPGLTEGLDSMGSLLPKVQRIVGAVAGELGNISSETGASLASARWADFFDFLATDAPQALADMAAAAGNTGHAMAEMWMAFDPVNDDFSQWMVDATQSLDEWASGLSKTQGFAEFMQYLETTGPQVASALGAIGDAALQIAEAAAPIGGPVLAGIEAFANVVSAIADSDLGTPIFGAVAALSALNIAMRTSAALSKATFGSAAVGAIKKQSAGYVAAFRDVKTATVDLQKAETARVAAAQKAANLQSALVPAATKRGGVTEYVAAAKAQESAALRVAAAEKARGAAIRETAVTAGKAGALVAGLTVATTGLGDSVGLTNTASLALMGSMAGPWGTALGAATGYAIDLSHANDDLGDSIAVANAAMKAGDVDAMAASYKKLNAQIAETNDTGGIMGNKNRLKNVVGYITGDIQDAKKQQEGLLGSINGAAAASAFTGITDGFASVTAAAARATGSVQGFLAALAAINGTLSHREALRQYTESLLNANAAIRENGKTLTKSGAAFKGHAREGLASQRTLDAIAASAVNVAKDMKPLQGARFLKNAQGDFTRLAQGMGLSRAAARNLSKELLTLGGMNAKPKVQEQGAAASRTRIKAMRAEIAALKSKSVKMNESGAAAARARIAALRAEIAALRSKTITVHTNVTRSGGAMGGGGQAAGATTQARGNLYYAYGDIANRHEPQLAGPGPARVWREPETQGEAYIPLANDDRRPRARAIASETVALLGGTAYFADGGLSFARGGTRKPKNDDTHHHVNKFAAALKEATKAINKEKAARDALISKRSDLSGTVRDAFRTDPFGESNVWAQGGGSPLAILKADIAKAQAFKTTLGSLKKAGLDGDAFASIAATGDIGKANALLSLGKAGVGQYESAFNTRATVTSTLGSYAGTAAYGSQIALSNKHLVALNREVRALRHEVHGHPERTGKATGKALNKSSGKAKRRNR